MRNFFLIKHHPRGLTEAYQKNSCRTPAPRHTLPALAGRHDDENLISLTRPSVNNPNLIIQSERVVLGEQAIVSKKGCYSDGRLVQADRHSWRASATQSGGSV
jgi:hypothetical protein